MPAHPTHRRSSRQFHQKRLLLVLGVLAFTAVVVYAGHRLQVSRQAPALLERGRAAAGEKSWKAAIEAFNQYLRLRPRDSAAHIDRADAFAATGRYKDAVDGYLEGLAHEPDRLDARRKLADLYHAAGKSSAAREQVMKLLGPGGKTTDPTLYMLLADCAFWDKKSADERKYLEAAVELPGAVATASYRLADRIRTAENSPQGIAAADAVMARLVSARPADLECRLLRSAYRKKYGDKTGARADLEFAYQSIPGAKTDPPLIGEYVPLLRTENDTAAAERVVRASRAAMPDDTRLTLLLASVLFDAGTPEKRTEARELIRQVSAALPDGDRRLLALGDTLIDTGDDAAARAAAARLAKVPAGKPLAAYLTGRLALARGDWPTALIDLTASLPALPKTSPENAVAAKAYLALAQAHASALDTAGQLASARAALAISPGWPPAKLLAADALLRQDKRSEAVELLRPLVSATPAARVMLARVRLAEALSHPDNPGHWRDFEAAVGSPPYPTEIGLMLFQSRVARKDPNVLPDLEAELTKSPKSPELWLALIAVRGDADPVAARAALEKAVAALGDRADLRLARANLLARDRRTLNPAAVLALADDPAGEFSKDDRVTLLRGLADVLANRGFPKDALPLLREILPLRPHDLSLRLRFFDLANTANDAAASALALTEIRRLDTAAGPIARVAEVVRELTTTPHPAPAQIAAWREQLTAAAAARDAWARPHALLGDLAKFEKRSDAALAHYQAAMERGGSGDRVTQSAVELLMGQQNYAAAVRLMAQLNRSDSLSPAMRNQYKLLRAASGDDADTALKLVRSSEMVASDNYRDHLLRAFVFQMYGEPKEAGLALNKALARNASAPEVWEAKVRSLVGVNKEAAILEVERAAVALRKPADADPMTAALTVGHLREVVGQSDEAEAEYTSATALDRADRRPVERLYDLYRRTKQEDKADALLEPLGGTDTSLGRWARRQKALAMVEKPQGFTRIPEAVALLDGNLEAAGESVEDVRAKAVVRAFDPLQRKDALAALSGSLSRGPLTAAENLLYARLFLQSGRVADAERLLVAATSGGPRAAPVQLALLASVRTKRGDTAAARRTVERLKLIDPFGWNTAVESARLLAKTDKPAAAKVLLAHRAAKTPAGRVYLIAPTLEGLGCPDDAKTLLEAEYAASTAPGRHVPLTELLIRTKQADAAIDLALKHTADVPAGFTARLISGAVHGRHMNAVPPAEKEAWRKRVGEVTARVGAKAKEYPTDANLLFARAELADARGAYDEAIDLYGRAADRAADPALKASLKNNRAWLMAVSQKNGGEEPMRLVNEAINALGPVPTLLATRGTVHLAGGRPEQALIDLDAAADADTRGTFQFRRAVAFDKWKKPVQRDAAVAEAVTNGLTRDALHPLDWPDYDRLVRK